MSVEFIGGLPESLTQRLLVGKLLVGGLGVAPPGLRGSGAESAALRGVLSAGKSFYRVLSKLYKHHLGS